MSMRLTRTEFNNRLARINQITDGYKKIQPSDKSVYWRLIRAGTPGFWLFNSLVTLKECIEFTYPGCNITYDPCDPQDPDNDCNVFIDGDLFFRIVETEQGLITEKQVLLV